MTTKVVVIGFDGIDSHLLQRLMNTGQLPVFEKIAVSGSHGEVLSTTPAESSVAWSAFTMGTNPGGTSIFDFIGRKPGYYSAQLQGVEIKQVPYTKYNHAKILAGSMLGMVTGAAATRKMNRRTWLKATACIGAAGVMGVGTTFLSSETHTQDQLFCTVRGTSWWERLEQLSEKQSVALRIPMTFPVRSTHSNRVLAGLGTPDVRGTNGVYCVIEVNPGKQATVDQKTIRLKWDAKNAVASLPAVDGAESSQPLMYFRKTESDCLQVRSSGKWLDLVIDQWSDWIPVTAHSNSDKKLRGMVRMYRSNHEGVEKLYVTPIEFDPIMPPIDEPIASPQQLPQELARTCGRFHTSGWETQTWGVVDGVLSPEAYLQEVFMTMKANLQVLMSEMNRPNWANLMMVVQATDQASHLFFDDHIQAVCDGTTKPNPSHPLIAVYRKMDEMVRQISSQCSKHGYKLIVMSDHGFAPYRRSVNLNTWLAKCGWLALKDKTKWDENSAGQVLANPTWSNVDWFNTRAFALGLGGIYFNVEGREPNGIVSSRDELAYLKQRLSDDLLQWTDPVNQQSVFANIYDSRSIYTGDHIEHAPDLIVGLNRGYRISSVSAVGGMPEAELNDNTSAWCADHCGIDANQIPGVLFTNFPNNWPKQVPIHELRGLIWPELREAV